MTDTQTILFGSDLTSGIVAVEAEESEVILYIRRNGKFREARRPFSPWLLVTRAEDVPAGAVCTELHGEGYRFKAIFSAWSEFAEARNILRTKNTDHLAYLSPEKQFLVSTGMTLFKGLAFDDIHRMQIDIETAGLSFEPESNRILLIAVSDNFGFETILEGGEYDMLSRLVAIVRERNPDVIEGHNIFGFDLPFLAARARKVGVRLRFGRDGSEMRFGHERGCTIGANSRPFIPAYIHGRHVIDTLYAVQRFDSVKGQLERYGLKECAQVFGLSEPDRIYIPGDKIATLWENDPETVKIYAAHDVRETRKLAALVCPAEFYLAQMTPDVFQSTAISGTGEKINSILVREYLRQKYAIPYSQKPRAVPGGYTELRDAGLIRRVVKCDVESLYPSLMLSRGIKPASDALDVFLPALGELTQRRMDAKSKSKSEADSAYWDGLQNSFKILINSFYGYLGAPFSFNDYDAAEQVTVSGQEIVKQIADSIERNGGRVIEIDTDGVYFQPPAGVTNDESEEALVELIGRDLPDGIRLAHDGRYAAMLSLKVKNYVLIGYDGKKIFRGTSVRSRADEPFGREFISRAVDLLLDDDRTAVSKLYLDFAAKIRNGQLPVEQFARRERVTPKTFSSTQKKRMAAVAKGVNIGDYIVVYEKSNGDLGLIQEYGNDENRDHLLGKLYKFAARLKQAFGSDFGALFPKPGVDYIRQAEEAGQQRFEIF